MERLPARRVDLRSRRESSTGFCGGSTTDFGLSFNIAISNERVPWFVLLCAVGLICLGTSNREELQRLQMQRYDMHPLRIDEVWQLVSPAPNRMPPRMTH